MTQIDSISLNNLNDVTVTSSSTNATRWYGGRRFTLKVGTTSEDVVLIDLYKKAQELSKQASTAEEWTKLKSFIEQLQEAETNAAETYEKRDDYSFYKFSSWFHRLFGGAFLGSHSKRLNKLEKNVKRELLKSSIDLLRKNGLALQQLSDQDKNSHVKVQIAAKQNIKALEYANDTLKADEAFMLNVARDNIEALAYASDTLKRNNDFMLRVIEFNSKALVYANDTLQADQNFMLEAVKRNIEAIDYASAAQKADEDFILKALKFDHMILEHLPELTKNKDFMLKAVVQITSLLDVFIWTRYSNTRANINALIGDRDFMLTAITLKPEALKYAEKLLSDENFLIDAIHKNPKAFPFVPDEFKTDPSFLANFPDH